VEILSFFLSAAVIIFLFVTTLSLLFLFFLLRFYREANILSCVRLKIHYSLIKKISLHSPIIVIMLNCFVVPKEKIKKKGEREQKNNDPLISSLQSQF